MSELRYRTFRLKVYARLCPTDLDPKDREEFMDVLDRVDEDGMEAFFGKYPLDPAVRRVIQLLKEARGLGERINVLDRTVPALPHAEIAECYNRLRALGDAIGAWRLPGS